MDYPPGFRSGGSITLSLPAPTPMVLGCVSVWGSTPGVGKSILVYNQVSRSTQPGHPSMGTSRMAVMLCSCRVKAGIVREWEAGVIV